MRDVFMGDDPHDPAVTTASRNPPEKRLRLIVVGHSGSGHVFGAERSLLDILAAADRHIYEVVCILPKTGLDPNYRGMAERTATRVVTLDYGWSSKGLQASNEKVAEFAALFADLEADLVHVNTITLLEPLLAAKRIGIPAIVHARELLTEDPDLTHALRTDAATVISTVLAASNYLIANSDATRRAFQDAISCFRVYNCVDRRHFQMANDVKPGNLKVGMISSNLPKKGIRAFIELAIETGRRRPDIEFVLIGPKNPPVSEMLQTALAEGHRFNFRATGYIPDTVAAMSEINVLMSLSIVPESFGRTVAEAMASARPVVAYRHGAMPELVRHGVDGFLLPYMQPAGGLAYLVALADDPFSLRAMGESGRARALDMFAPDVFARDLNAAYAAVLETAKSRRP